MYCSHPSNTLFLVGIHSMQMWLVTTWMCLLTLNLVKYLCFIWEGGREKLCACMHCAHKFEIVAFDFAFIGGIVRSGLGAMQVPSYWVLWLVGFFWFSLLHYGFLEALLVIFGNIYRNSSLTWSYFHGKIFMEKSHNNVHCQVSIWCGYRLHPVTIHIFFFIICNPLTTYKHYNFDLFLIIIFFVWPIFHGFYTVVVLTSVGWTNCSCFDQVYLFLCPRYIT